MEANPDLATQLHRHGILNPGKVHWNLSADELYAEIVNREEGKVTEGDVIVVTTGKHTGRSPQDRFIVKDSTTQDSVDWGAVNKPFGSEQFDKLYERVMDHLEGMELFAKDLCVCAHPDYKMSIRVITELAWHNLFATNLFVCPDPSDVPHSNVEFTVIDVPSFKADPERDGTRTETFIILNLEKKIALIGGTYYAGEIKKSVFSSLNFFLPDKGVFPMHCSANKDADGNTAIFFGLSGTGKTTLSADPDRWLIGDDEHGWASDGVFNFEGGCYAKVIRLSSETEPDIYKASTMRGAIIENVVVDGSTNKIDFDDDSLTENTRSAYPITHLSKIVPEGVGANPKTIFMLTFDAFGVLPPISKLTTQQAMYYFLLGYTAKVAGTERGVDEPQATFSTCFGAPFLPRHPMVYAKMLGEKLEEHNATVWLLNTCITGGPYAFDSRIPLNETMALVSASLERTVQKAPVKVVDLLRLQVPEHCPGVSDELLEPRKCWPDPSEYDAKAGELAARFAEVYKKYES